MKPVLFDKNSILDDKVQVIWALLLIALFAMFKLPDAAMTVNSIVSGLLGVAVGKAIK